MSGGMYLFYLLNGLIILGEYKGWIEVDKSIKIERPIILDQRNRIQYNLMEMLDLTNNYPPIIIEINKVIFSTDNISKDLIDIWNKIYSNNNPEVNLQEYKKEKVIEALENFG